MSVNISQGYVFNTGSGTIVLTDTQLRHLFDPTDAGTVSVATGDSIGVGVRLQNRFVLEEIRLEGSNFETFSIEASQENTLWKVLPCESFSGGVTVSGYFTSSSDWPKYVNFYQEATSTIAELSSVSLVGSVGDIGFGGLESGVDIDASVDSEPMGVSVFNSGNSSSNFYCYVGVTPQESFTSIASLADSISGSYYSTHARGIRMPRDYSWASGDFFNTTTSGGCVLLGPTKIFGYYTSPVFDVNSHDTSRVYWEYYDEVGTSITTVSGYPQTIHVRTSNVSPIGGWTSGSYPSLSDPLWGNASGTLSFKSIAAEDILEASVGQYKYVQLRAYFNSTITGKSSRLYSLGLEKPVSLSASPHSSSTLYVKTTVLGYVPPGVDIIVLNF